MHKKTKSHCDSGCGGIVTERIRNRYFTGKHLTAQDFIDEQEYFLSRHRLHNRLLHGWGVVCGLLVVPHNKQACRREWWLVVGSGIALDCCGRELILPEDRAVSLKDLVPPPATVQGGLDQSSENDAPVHKRLLLCLCYEEEPFELVPALHATNGCNPKHHENNRIRETVRFELVDPDEIPGCWPPPEPAGHCGHGSGEKAAAGPGGSCLAPDCSLGGRVPLAFIEPKPDADEDPPYTIDMTCRPSLSLTHVVAINWPHGGRMPLDHLAAMEGKLKVDFSQPLQDLESCSPGTGINRYTFTVQRRGMSRHFDFLDGDVALAEDGMSAVFSLRKTVPEGESEASYKALRDDLVHVTLKCDFILDCNGKPVDGDFLGGKPCTGNGVPGGTFESWFTVTEATKTEGVE